MISTLRCRGSSVAAAAAIVVYVVLRSLLMRLVRFRPTRRAKRIRISGAHVSYDARRQSRNKHTPCGPTRGNRSRG